MQKAHNKPQRFDPNASIRKEKEPEPKITLSEKTMALLRIYCRSNNLKLDDKVESIVNEWLNKRLKQTRTSSSSRHIILKSKDPHEKIETL